MKNKYLKVTLDGKPIEIDAAAQFPVAIDYQLEDVNDFQKKKSSESFNIKLPATKVNDQRFNTYHNPSIDDLTENQIYRGLRKIVIEATGEEVLVGKALLNRVKSRFNQPTSYEISAFGNNADWMIDLKESTLYQFLSHVTCLFVAPTIVASWSFDGTNEDLPFVFAPVKYANYLDFDAGNDNNYSLTNMKPSVSIYWIIYWAFKSVGYTIQSEFFNTPYFRKMVMPWIWGGFLSSEGTKYETHLFLAKSISQKTKQGDYFDFWNLEVTNDSTNGGFDNNTVNTPLGDYTYINEDEEMRWTYNAPNYGILEAHFALTLDVDIKLQQSSTKISVVWYKNGVEITPSQTILDVGDTTISDFTSTQELGLHTVFFTQIVEPGDYVSARIFLNQYESKLGFARTRAKVAEFKMDYFRIPVGGTIAFDSYFALQKDKFLDLLRGVADTFNLSFQTDSVNKIVCIEPTHAYSLTDDLSERQGGYFIENARETVNWSKKRDVAKENDLELFKDYDREVTFKFKPDGSDGAYKLVKDRHITEPSTGKYVFPERFKSGQKDIENRFFSATMHYDVSAFKGITGVAPQIICMVPENISNTSSGEAGNTFQPKMAYYKGVVSGVGGWRFENEEYTDYPYMFSVNYKPGGQHDPILSYSDEKIGLEASSVYGKGLLKRFFWQRLAIMRNGQYLTDNFYLKNIDISNWFHRERITINGNLWELITIKGYKPMSDESTQCFLRRYYPITSRDQESTYPSEGSILNDALDGTAFDIKYTRLMCLSTDIPNPT